jgi:parallel beta-helix repeat protein
LYGIELENLDKYNTISGNTVNSNGYYGIILYSWDNNNTISGNTVNSNEYEGIRLEDSHNNTISGNTVSSNYYGITFDYGSTYNTISGNTVSNNEDLGIWLVSSSNNNTLTNNTVTNNTDYGGIYLYSSSNNNTISYNLVRNNAPYGIYLVGGSTGNTIEHNNIMSNGNYNGTSEGWEWNFYNDQPDAVDAKHNYWVAVTNETIDASIYDNEEGKGEVTFYPFETEPVPGAPVPEQPIFDTDEGTYPSIMGTHTGTIKPSRNITASTLYTYPCPGTGGHAEYVRIYGNGIDKIASWTGYGGDWHNIRFNKTFVLYENETYNYTIRTGSYPQIIHEGEFNATGGTITCTSFEDANGNVHTNLGCTPESRQ